MADLARRQAKCRDAPTEHSPRLGCRLQHDHVMPLGRQFMGSHQPGRARPHNGNAFPAGLGGQVQAPGLCLGTRPPGIVSTHGYAQVADRSYGVRIYPRRAGCTLAPRSRPREGASAFRELPLLLCLARLNAHSPDNSCESDRPPGKEKLYSQVVQRCIGRHRSPHA